MRLWPRTLFWRLVVILVGGMLAAQLLTGSIWYDVRHTQALEIPLRLAAARLADLQRVQRDAPAQLETFLRAQDKPGFRVSLETLPEADYVPGAHPMAEHLLARALAEQGGDPARLRLRSAELVRSDGSRAGQTDLLGSRVDARLTMELQLADGRWLHVDMIEAQGWNSLSALDVALDYLLRLYLLRIVVVLLLALLAVRLAIGPLNTLARAAEALGDDIRRPPLEVEGPLEVRRAAGAFNAMQRRLVASLGERTRFLAAVSHDLRSPITRLRLRTEMLDSEPLRERFRKDLDDMEGMVTATLDFISDGDLDETRQEVDLDALLQGLQVDLEEQGVALPVSGRALRPLPGYARSLRRALQNLVENSLRYAGMAEVVVEDGPRVLRLSVLDRGPGIPEAHLDRVSEPFYRVEGSRNRASGGYGLGLSIAQTVAAAHHGRLTLRNREGGGLEAELLFERQG